MAVDNFGRLFRIIPTGDEFLERLLDGFIGSLVFRFRLLWLLRPNAALSQN